MAYQCCACNKKTDNPITLECGHNFHVRCFYDTLIGIKCPICLTDAITKQQAAEMVAEEPARRIRVNINTCIWVGILCVIFYFKYRTYG